jgi:hypothetical protein
VWFITWGLDSCHLLYPEGTSGGLIREDHGKQRVLDGSGNAYYAFEETFRMHSGVAVRDWRKLVRVANIDVSNMQAGSVDLYGLMRKAYYQIHGARTLDNGTVNGGIDGNFGRGRTVIYCNKDVFEALDALGTNSGASDNFVRLMPRELDGREIMTYRGMPIRQVDQRTSKRSRRLLLRPTCMTVLPQEAGFMAARPLSMTWATAMCRCWCK